MMPSITLTHHEITRAGMPWTINEELRLERESELLGLSIDEIAALHQRSPFAIECRLSHLDISHTSYHSRRRSPRLVPRR